ncbi:unnamed protein product [Adineta steineri]|uniref:ADP ribosyltransferase domain-containing protein n=1 Tax=Adineta steineri TaxID=433720 RepID=A0A819RIF5_9BILA|nr:unnamed protein product [Adineta steineri]CAF4046609.1 unnamed protein product [Adineta steineri]
MFSLENNDNDASKQELKQQSAYTFTTNIVTDKSTWYSTLPASTTAVPADLSKDTLLSPKTSTALALERSSVSKNFESITLLWNDQNIDKTEDTKRTMKKLREINDFVVFHTDTEECIAYAESVESEKIFIVTSGRSATRILDATDKLPQVDTIFIFCFKPEKYQNLLEKFTKLKGIYHERHILISSIKENVRLFEKQMETFNFYDQCGEKSTRDLSKEAAEFLWFQVFKDIILRMKLDKLAKTQMIEFCRYYYRGNTKQMAFIDEFEEQYKPDAAIRWYTRETFLYKLVNKALRTEDIEQLHIFRFFIADLSLNLAAEYRKIKDSGEDVVMLYRGQKMEENELLTLQQNQGNLISANGFLSTSRSKELAFSFATKLTTRANVLPVLYEIECDVQSTIFADIAQFSDYPKESEVLFDLGSTFRIVSVVDDTQLKLWIIKMKTIDEGTKLARQYIEANRKDENKITTEMVFGKLLLLIGKYDQTIAYFQNLLSDPTHSEHNAWIYNLLGVGYHYKNNLEKAVENYERSYNMVMNARPLRIDQSIRPLANIGLIYHQRRDYKSAFEAYSKVIKTIDKYYGKHHLKTTKTLINIGSIHVELKEYDRALEVYENVLKIQLKELLSDHIDISMTLNNIGVIYQKLGKNDCAIGYYRKSLQIKQKLLPPNHPDIHLTEHNIYNINNPQLEYPCMATSDEAARKRRSREKVKQCLLDTDTSIKY